MSLTVQDIDLETALEIQKRRNIRMLEVAQGEGNIHESESPFSRDNLKKASNHFVEVKKRERFDVQNIGSGTRCTNCGMLHFCWTPRCAVCSHPMHYNLGGHHR